MTKTEERVAQIEERFFAAQDSPLELEMVIVELDAALADRELELRRMM